MSHLIFQETIQGISQVLFRGSTQGMPEGIPHGFFQEFFQNWKFRNRK